MAAWDIKQSDLRTANEIPLFVIFCEDEVGEIDYIKSFETDRIKINPIGNQKAGFQNVVKAIRHCRENNLFITDEQHNERVPDEGTFVWCVFDRDRNPDLENGEEDIAFDESITMAETKNIHVAWSNDAFELWLLLHFEEIDPTQPENRSREVYYQRLTYLFRNLVTTNGLLIQKRASPLFNYKDSLKPRRAFIPIVLPELKNNVDIAITRAVALDGYHAHLQRTPTETSPCTKMHHLIQQIRLHN